MDYLWDTSILIHHTRNSNLFDEINAQHHFFEAPNRSFLSIVSLGEIYSIAVQRNWGKRKRETLEHAVSMLNPLTIAKRTVIQAYAEIDPYSQGKHPKKRLPSGMSVRNIGKNDLWIAATAYVIGSRLVTTDQDFRHLDGTYLDVVWIQQ